MQVPIKIHHRATSDEPRITITKRDAALRQLRAAIRLWFDDGDQVAIHTLLAAAYEIIHALFRQKGLSDLIFDSVLVKDEHRKEWSRRVKSHANFFKHAREDISGTIEFIPYYNEFFMIFSIVGLQRMGEERGLEERAFIQWTFINRPDHLKEGAYADIPVEALETLRSYSKRDFFAAFPEWEKARVQT